MGGGGGGSGYFDTDPDQLKQKLRESEENTESAEYEANVTALLTSLLTVFNDRNDQIINRHLDEIQQALEKELDGIIKLLFGGSVAKHTYVDGLSDIDSLVILNNCDLADQPPEDSRDYFARRLQDCFPETEIKTGRLAVTISFSDAEIQLLPAISCQNQVKIADATGNGWALIKPKEFTDVLTRTNQQTGRTVIPVVKLAKAIIAALPKKQRITGYHAESLAVEIFKSYEGALTLKMMLKHYFQIASDLVRQPIFDRTGQSVHVDDYLGSPNSVERRIISDAFGRVGRRMNNADNAVSIDEWRKLFDE
jgi:hypothetical protein